MANWWDGPIIQQYYWSWSGWWKHSGIDIGLPFGTPITTPVNGIVIGAGCFPWGGQVDIRFIEEDGNPRVMSFLHLSQLAGQLQLHIGESITAGTVIGFSGGSPSQGNCPTQSRYSSALHLHWEITFGTSAPYSSAEGHYYNPAYAPILLHLGTSGSSHPNLDQHPLDGNALLQVIQAGDGIAPSADAGSSGPSGPTPGQKAHSLLDSVPGFIGICEALDAVESFEPYTPPASGSGGLLGVSNVGDVFGYAITWTARNMLTVFVRLFIAGIGIGLILLLIFAMVQANKWVQDAEHAAIGAAMMGA